MSRAALLGFLITAAAWPDVVADVRTALAAHNTSGAEAIAQRYRASQGTTSEYLEAYSWLARAALADKQYDHALDLATQTRDLAVASLKKRPLDADKSLPLALGAAIEVTAQSLAAQGQRDQAVTLLQQQIAVYRNTSIRARLQKNLNLLTLEGKSAPPLDTRQHVGSATPPSLAQLRGKPVILFFWAHWCGDCKREVALLARLHQEYAGRGLVLVGPTQHYGYVANGQDAKPAEELRYIEQVRQQYYAPLSFMPVPLSEETFKNYGASTTPTLVFIDRHSIVRLYHPGEMSYEELTAAVRRIL